MLAEKKPEMNLYHSMLFFTSLDEKAAYDEGERILRVVEERFRRELIMEDQVAILENKRD